MTNSAPSHTLRRATIEDAAILLPMIVALHEHLQIVRSTKEQIRQALLPLLSSDRLGVVWLLEVTQEVVGYIVVCFGYSLEFGGRDAMLDEMYLLPNMRGLGLGTRALRRAADRLQNHYHVQALHLEVARDALANQRLYHRVGFRMRSRFSLMTWTLAQHEGGHRPGSA